MNIRLIIIGVCFYVFLGCMIVKATDDVVYLKNGNIIHGNILELFANESLRIQEPDGFSSKFDMDEIFAITKERRNKLKPYRTPDEDTLYIKDSASIFTNIVEIIYGQAAIIQTKNNKYKMYQMNQISKLIRAKFVGMDFPYSEIDIVYLKDSTNIFGRIIELVPNDYFIVEQNNGKLITIKCDQVERCASQNIQRINTESLNHQDNVSYGEIGVMMSTTYLIRPTIGFWTKNVGFRVGFITYNRQSNFEFELCFPIITSRNNQQSINIMFSNISSDKMIYETRKFLYNKKYLGTSIGVGYGLNTSGFDFQAGFGSDLNSAFIWLQLGYLFQINFN